jgi:ribonuclease J
MVLGEMQNSLLKERLEISEEGVVVVSLVLDDEYRLAARPRIESIGFLHMDDAEQLRGDLTLEIENTLEKHTVRTGENEQRIAQKVRSRVRNVLKKHIRALPVIKVLVTIVER